MYNLIDKNYEIMEFMHYDASSEKESNDAVRMSLLESGDDGKQPRDVRHFIFKSDECANSISITAIQKVMLPFNFKFERINDPFGLVMSHDREVASSEFDELTTELTNLAEENGWIYTGWEARVLVKYAATPHWPESKIH